MICPKCGRETEGKFCSSCGTLLTGPGRRTARSADDFSGVDFVPQDDAWAADTGERPFREETDLDETVVLEPLEQYDGEKQRSVYHWEGNESPVYPEYEEKKESSGKKYGKYGRDPYDSDSQKRHSENGDIRGGERQSGKKSRPGNRTVYEEQVTRKKKKHKGRAAASVKSVGKVTGKAVGGTLGRILPLVLRLASFVLMGGMTVRLFTGFWSQRDVLGSMVQMVSDRNYAEGLYLILAAALLAYGVVSAVWILTRRRIACDGRMRRFDTGRGLVPFVIFAGLTFLAARTAVYLPGSPHVLSGLGQFFLVLAAGQSWVYVCSVLGIICCIIRKILRH
ncbi:hypothetical protein LQE92_01840 [Lacrimispora sp. NSJ-141]|uniref:Zinc ribbon domain-containing protein n=1 Tax=Lientehia hominis TaxID=2897778 RepID=A0AAP2W6J8_9FIRM|nr:hypothetical protein [Lientehia hominis]MCD2491368.1 hypothetical protein [Lientehia hominis]